MHTKFETARFYAFGAMEETHILTFISMDVYSMGKQGLMRCGKRNAVIYKREDTGQS